MTSLHYSIDWQRLNVQHNVMTVQVTLLDEASGNVLKIVKLYEEWIGVCTNDIDRVVRTLTRHFPNHSVTRCERIHSARKVLPYFEERLRLGKLEYRSKPFYQLFTTAPHSDVGKIFNRYKICYYDPEDWLIRLYLDFCFRYDADSFYYKWYDLRNDFEGLMDSLILIPDRWSEPDWTVAAFDLESVPLEGQHVPIGYHASDRIVMISLYKWRTRQRRRPRRWILYLLPDVSLPPAVESGGDDDAEEEAFATEVDMLIRFHHLLQDVQILTGYNINAFDLPCLFARLLWLRHGPLLSRYGSSRVGTDLVVRYDAKLTIDLYPYFKTFSGYDLPSFKLDDVARIKLGGETKLPVKATGLWSWYRRDAELAARVWTTDDVQRCFDVLKPETVTKASSFGTFRTYLDYCLKDSELVYRLFVREDVLSFLVGRANLGPLSVIEALHQGNSRYLLDLFRTVGLRLGFLVQPNFFEGFSKDHRQRLLPDPKKTYQGALNFCTSEKTYEDVSVMDFTSMYPSALLSGRLCYGTCTIMTREDWSSHPVARRLTAIPYRQHSDQDFLRSRPPSEHFSYPEVTEDDAFVIVVNTETEAFLPRFVDHFIRLRQHHQRRWKETREVTHYNAQLGIKILINSLYGVMANKESPLAYLPIAMSIVALSRYQLLGSYHYLKDKGYDVCYADTDSLMVHRWPSDDCDPVNRFLNLPHVTLKYEQRMKRLLVLSKKRYVYENGEGSVVTKGFQKKVNGLVEFMTDTLLKRVWHDLFDDSALPSPAAGWILWVETIQEANYRCRDPKKYSIYRKMKHLNEYKSKNCPSVKYLKKYPDRMEEYVEFTYSRADVAASEASNWIMDVEDVQWVNYEQLFLSQKNIFYILLNMTYWHLPNPTLAGDMVLNTLHWKRFVHAELLHWHATGKFLNLMVETGVRYTFTMNDHLTAEPRRPGRKRKTIPLFQ